MKFVGSLKSIFTLGIFCCQQYTSNNPFLSCLYTCPHDRVFIAFFLFPFILCSFVSVQLATSLKAQSKFTVESISGTFSASAVAQPNWEVVTTLPLVVFHHSRVSCVCGEQILASKYTIPSSIDDCGIWCSICHHVCERLFAHPSTLFFPTSALPSSAWAELENPKVDTWYQSLATESTVMLCIPDDTLTIRVELVGPGASVSSLTIVPSSIICALAPLGLASSIDIMN